MMKFNVGDLVQDKLSGLYGTITGRGYGDGSDVVYACQFFGETTTHYFMEHQLKVVSEDVCNSDLVNHPDHYTSGGIETIDFIRAKLSPEAFNGFCIGNVIKYSSRYALKNGLEDLKKAQVYIGWAIESLEGRDEK